MGALSLNITTIVNERPVTLKLLSTEQPVLFSYPIPG